MKSETWLAFIGKAVLGALIGAVVTYVMTQALHPVAPAAMVGVRSATGAGASVTVFNPHFHIQAGAFIHSLVTALAPFIVAAVVTAFLALIGFLVLAGLVLISL